MRQRIRGGIVTLKYLTSTTNSAGVTYFYLRRKGQPKISLGRGQIDDPAFLARYAAALDTAPKRTRRASHGTIAALCEAFRAGTTYASYSAAYKGTLTRHMDNIRSAYADAKISDLRARHIRADLSQLQPHAANDRLKTWRLLCELAFGQGWTGGNATDGVKRGRLPKTDGHTPWSAADIAAYRNRWDYGTPQRLAMELLFWTAARTIDAVTLSPAMVGADGVLVFTQAKTKGKAFIPWSCALPGWAIAMDIDRQHLSACLRSGSFTYLETSNGRARSRKGLSNIISAGIVKAGLSGLSAHGLRKARLTVIAEAGGSASAIMSWGGHKSLSEAEGYIATADRKSVIIGVEQTGKSANTSGQSANKIA